MLVFGTYFMAVPTQQMHEIDNDIGYACKTYPAKSCNNLTVLMRAEQIRQQGDFLTDSEDED